MWGRRRLNAGAVARGDAWLLPISASRQSLPYSCGVACCGQIVQFRTGLKFTDADLAGRYGLKCERGTSYEDMTRILRGETKAEVTRLRRVRREQLAQLLRAGSPVIAGVAVKGGSHAIVIRGFLNLTGECSHVVVNDPVMSMSLLSAFDTVGIALEDALAVQWRL